MRAIKTLAAMALIIGASNDMYNTPKTIINTTATPSWDRKKCKSCANYKGGWCSIKGRKYPTSKACYKYEKRTKQ